MASVSNETEEIELWKKIAGIIPPTRSGEYWSCNWLEGGLALLDDNIHNCCAHDPLVIAKLSECDTPPYEKILKARQDIIAKVNRQGEGHPVCSKCVFLCKKRWEAKKYLFDYVTIATQRLCNLHCKFCDIVTLRTGNYSASSHKYISCVGLFKDMIEKGLLSPYATINISGGEPVLFPEFNELVELLAPTVGELKIFSNGTIFSKSLLKVLYSPATKLVLSLDAADRKTYERIKGQDLCDAAWGNAAQYAFVGKERVFVKMIITEDNIDNVAGFVERAKKNNILSLHYDLDKNETIAHKLSHERFHKYTHAIADFKLECLKNEIACSSAQAGCTGDIEEESEHLLREKAKKMGLAVRSCALKCQTDSYAVESVLVFFVEFTGYNAADLEFKFFSKHENMNWQEMQAYSPRNTCCWKPDQPGRYSICAYLRYKNSQLVFTDHSQIELRIE
jgi:MoaA/NifB/PqqE/SkfB family radical SAM enzyme